MARAEHIESALFTETLRFVGVPTKRTKDLPAYHKESFPAFVSRRFASRKNALGIVVGERYEVIVSGTRLEAFRVQRVLDFGKEEIVESHEFIGKLPNKSGKLVVPTRMPGLVHVFKQV